MQTVHLFNTNQSNTPHLTVNRVSMKVHARSVCTYVNCLFV